MGISQDRILDLIAAADDYRKAAQQLCDNIQSLVRLAMTHRLNAADVTILSGLTSPEALLTQPVRSPATIERERDHFKLRAGRNARQKRYMAKRREGGTRLTTEETNTQMAELLGITPDEAAARMERTAPVPRHVPPVPSPAGHTMKAYGGYNPADDGDPEDSMPARPVATDFIPNRRPFTGPDFESPSAPATKESRDGDE